MIYKSLEEIKQNLKEIDVNLYIGNNLWEAYDQIAPYKSVEYLLLNLLYKKSVVVQSKLSYFPYNCGILKVANFIMDIPEGIDKTKLLNIYTDIIHNIAHKSGYSYIIIAVNNKYKNHISGEDFIGQSESAFLFGNSVEYNIYYDENNKYEPDY